MLYSEKELEKRLKAGCALYYFYASDEALVHTAAQKTLKYLNRDDPETTVLDGPTPSVEEIVQLPVRFHSSAANAWYSCR